VFLVLPGSGRIINLNEIEIFTLDPFAYALQEVPITPAMASQSSVVASVPTLTAAACADGNLQDTWCHTATATDGGSAATETNPWFRLDLQSAVSVHRVVLYNRRNGDQYKLNQAYSGDSGGFTIYVGADGTDATANTVCYTQSKSATFGTPLILYISCTQPVTGRYVFLYLPGTSRIINLMDVRVFSGGVPPPPPSLPSPPPLTVPPKKHVDRSVCCSAALQKDLFRMFIASTGTPLQNLCNPAC